MSCASERKYEQVDTYIYMRVVQKYFACGPQSPANCDPTGSNRGATLGIAAVSVSSFDVLSQALAFSHITKKEVT